jgi:hypothetical protein
MRHPKLLDTVAMRHDLPSHRLHSGEVGTVVVLLSNDAYEVEFCDDSGRAYAQLALRKDQIIPLHNLGKALRVALTA